MKTPQRLLDNLMLMQMIMEEPTDEVDELDFCKRCGKYPQTEERLCDECTQEVDELYDELKHPDDRG